MSTEAERFDLFGISPFSHLLLEIGEAFLVTLLFSCVRFWMKPFLEDALMKRCYPGLFHAALCLYSWAPLIFFSKSALFNSNKGCVPFRFQGVQVPSSTFFFWFQRVYPPFLFQLAVVEFIFLLLGSPVAHSDPDSYAPVDATPGPLLPSPRSMLHSRQHIFPPSPRIETHPPLFVIVFFGFGGLLSQMCVPT